MNCLLELIHNSLQNRLTTASFLLPQSFRARCDPLSAAFSLFQRHRLNTPPPKICQGKAFLQTYNFNGNIRQKIHNRICKISSLKRHFDCTVYLVSVCERGFSFLMRVRAAAASSNAQDTLEVNRRRTSGSARCFPVPVDNFPIPKLKENSIFLNVLNSAHW